MVLGRKKHRHSRGRKALGFWTLGVCICVDMVFMAASRNWVNHSHPLDFLE